LPFICLPNKRQAFFVFFRLRPDAVTSCLILAGPVFLVADLRFSAAVIFAATAFGLHDG
jgi:hypothetical protein